MQTLVHHLVRLLAAEADVNKFIMKIKLFNTDINIRDYYCDLNDEGYHNIESPYINLYIQMKGCNASCEFCEYKNSANYFNKEKLRLILDYLGDNIDVRKISITGGEPTLNINNLYNAIDIISDFKNKNPYVFLVMNTNGFNLKKLYYDKKIDFFDSIALSRHHYNDKINNSIFRTETVDNNSLKEIIKDNQDIFHFSCNLINGYISNNQEIYNYLNYCNDIGVYDVGFVGLMKINDYCKSNFVNFNLSKLAKDYLFKDRLFLIQKRNNKNVCQCFNYVFLPSNNFKKPVKIYSRCVLKQTCKYNNNLVFDGEYLRIGFNGKIII